MDDMKIDIMLMSDSYVLLVQDGGVLSQEVQGLKVELLLIKEDKII